MHPKEPRSTKPKQPNQPKQLNQINQTINTKNHHIMFTYQHSNSTSNNALATAHPSTQTHQNDQAAQPTQPTQPKQPKQTNPTIPNINPITVYYRYVVATVYVLLCGLSVTVMAQESTEWVTAMEEIRIERDAFTGQVRYLSKRTPEDKSGYSRLWLLIRKNSDEPKSRLMLAVSNYEQGAYNVRRNKIAQIHVLVDDTPMALPMSLGDMVGMYTQNCIFRLGIGRKADIYRLVQQMTTAASVRVRITLDNGIQQHFDVSSREQKAIADVLRLWNALPDKDKFGLDTDK
jgi:hypothetical protein